ncbi:kinase-like domain-containing protein [Massariosphaeria phaeospora]|uniref:Kinase-like domain-containing protein n=1 Tax=Massariosphaeria phaeospora TaxID=100035 RepID=A0A7C8IAN9_9PLEO|nr:kinase-like domain-containing protein [Massariosphaeria phaeospora]
MPPVSDLVRDSKLKTTFHGDITRHTFRTSGRDARQRKVNQEQRWQTMERLGQGAYGVVRRQKLIAGESDVQERAVKIIPKQSQTTPVDYSRELEAIAKFSHARYNSCFVESYGWYEDDDTIFIAMEYFEHGDLQTQMSQRHILPELEVQEVVFQVLEGLAFMHDNQFAHRDLKPSNILVRRPGPTWWVKIGDFGITKRAEEGSTALRTFSGTLGFLAPEVLISHGLLESEDLDYAKDYTVAVDIWALGEIAYRALSGVSPFTGSLSSYIKGKSTFPQEKLQRHKVSDEGCEFLVQTLKALPAERITSSGALQHPWIATQKDFSPRASEETLRLEEYSSSALFRAAPTNGVSTMTASSKASAQWSTIDNPSVSNNGPSHISTSTQRKLEKQIMGMVDNESKLDDLGLSRYEPMSYSTHKSPLTAQQEAPIRKNAKKQAYKETARAEMPAVIKEREDEDKLEQIEKRLIAQKDEQLKREAAAETARRAAKAEAKAMREKIANLERLVVAQRDERFKREAAVEAARLAERAETDLQAAKEAATKKAAAEAAKTLLEAARKARQEAEAKATREMEETKAAHEEALSEAKAAADELQKTKNRVAYADTPRYGKPPPLARQRLIPVKGSTDEVDGPQASRREDENQIYATRQELETDRLESIPRSLTESEWNSIHKRPKVIAPRRFRPRPLEGTIYYPSRPSPTPNIATAAEDTSSSSGDGKEPAIQKDTYSASSSSEDGLESQSEYHSFSSDDYLTTTRNYGTLQGHPEPRVDKQNERRDEKKPREQSNNRSVVLRRRSRSPTPSARSPLHQAQIAGVRAHGPISESIPKVSKVLKTPSSITVGPVEIKLRRKKKLSKPESSRSNLVSGLKRLFT